MADTDIHISVTDAKGKQQVYSGKALQGAADFLAKHSAKAQDADIRMSRKTSKGEARTFERRADDDKSAAAALSDAEAWLTEAR